jgi:shikimate dehydrogenase
MAQLTTFDPSIRSRQRFRLGLIGYPLEHSLSPKIHSAALKACGLEGDYSLFPVHPDDRQGLKNQLARVRSGEINGLNVTIPHKQTVIPLLDVLTSRAQIIGAVNTIFLRENKLVGHNTDAQGFLSDLKRFLTLGCDSLLSRMQEQRSALVLGAGGSARAVVYALLNDGWHVTLVARRLEQAQQLAMSFTNYEICITDDISNIKLSNIALIVNTTPVGMTPNVEQSPWLEKLPFPKAIIYDLIYNPRETKLVKDARAQGLPTTTGLGMLIEQAALAFELWTSRNPPRNILFDSVGVTHPD